MLDGVALLLSGSVVALVGAVLVWRTMAEVFARPGFLRTNYRGAAVPTCVGIVIPVVVVFSQALLVLVDALGATIPPEALSSAQISSLAALGYSLLGLFDDIAVDEGVSGFRGHLAVLARGRLSAGALKLVGGAGLAIVVVGLFGHRTVGGLLADGALVALSANLANLLDRAPGRVTKVVVIALIAVLAGVGARPELLGPIIVVAAGAGLLRADLRERLMLGDTGANPLGAAVGLAVALTCSTEVRAAALVVVVILNLVSERVSFSRVIDATPPLRWVDRLGRRPTPS